MCFIYLKTCDLRKKDKYAFFGALLWRHKEISDNEFLIEESLALI